MLRSMTEAEPAPALESVLQPEPGLGPEREPGSEPEPEPEPTLGLGQLEPARHSATVVPCRPVPNGSACEQTCAAVAVGSAQPEQAGDPVYHPSEHANGALEFTFVEPGPLGITFGDVAVR